MITTNNSPSLDLVLPSSMKTQSLTQTNSGCVNCGLGLISPGITKEDVLNSPSYQLILPNQSVNNLTYQASYESYPLELWISEVFWSNQTIWKCGKTGGVFKVGKNPVVVNYQVSGMDGTILSSGSEIIQNMTKVKADKVHKRDATRKFPVHVPKGRRVKVDVWIILPCNECCEVDAKKENWGRRRTIHRSFEFDYRNFDEPGRIDFGMGIIEHSATYTSFSGGRPGDDEGCKFEPVCGVVPPYIPDKRGD